MLILFLKVVLYDISRLKTDHVQPKTPLLNSDSKRPLRSGHAFYLDDKSSLRNKNKTLRLLMPDFFTKIYHSVSYHGLGKQTNFQNKEAGW